MLWLLFDKINVLFLIYVNMSGTFAGNCLYFQAHSFVSLCFIFLSLRIFFPTELLQTKWGFQNNIGWELFFRRVRQILNRLAPKIFLQKYLLHPHLIQCNIRPKMCIFSDHILPAFFSVFCLWSSSLKSLARPYISHKRLFLIKTFFGEFLW